MTFPPPPPLSPSARRLGLSGLVPQAIACFTALIDPELKWIALAAGFGYAAFIFSFLGGLWWGIALTCQNAPRWLYGVAVTPSLIALALYLPWTIGWSWPNPSLVILAVCLAGSLIIDTKVAEVVDLPDGWLSLRKVLSFGLAALTGLLTVA